MVQIQKNECMERYVELWVGIQRKGMTYLSEWMQSTKHRDMTISRSWMIRNKICQLDLKKETWEKRKKGKNAESQMPNLGPEALFCGRSRAIEVCDEFTAMCIVDRSFVASSYFLLEMKLCVHGAFHITGQCLPVEKAGYSCLLLLPWAWPCDLTWPMKY